MAPPLRPLSTEEHRFRTELTLSWTAVREAAYGYQARGYRIRIPEPRCRPDFDSREGWGDDYDLAIQAPGGGVQLLEVKWRKIDFTSAESYPYPTIFVDRVEKVNKNLTKLTGYLIVNKGLTGCLLIMSDTKPSWISSNRFDRPKRYAETVYECPKTLADFGWLYAPPLPRTPVPHDR